MSKTEVDLFQRIMTCTKTTFFPFCSHENKAAVAVVVLLLLSSVAVVLMCTTQLGVLSYHVGGEDEDSLVFSTGPLRVIQQIWVVLAKVPQVVPCREHQTQQIRGQVRSCTTSFQITTRGKTTFILSSVFVGSRLHLCPSCSGCCWLGPN